MSGFSAQWLALREPYDRAARDPGLLAAAVRPLAGLPRVSIVDLACGAGSTLRALGPHLPPRQGWKLVDNDLSLLARALKQAPPGADTTGTPIDLARDLELALDGPVDLVTTSALLDLVSERWLTRLATEIVVRRLPLYAALTYDGRVELAPAEELDVAVIAAVNRHQRGDKGFGPALGPAAADAAAARFEAIGYAVASAPSDWCFGPHDRAIQEALLAGWAAAAAEIGPLAGTQIEGWLARRLRHVAAGASSMRVGHVDLYAHPE